MSKRIYVDAKLLIAAWQVKDDTGEQLWQYWMILRAR